MVINGRSRRSSGQRGAPSCLRGATRIPNDLHRCSCQTVNNSVNCIVLMSWIDDVFPLRMKEAKEIIETRTHIF